MALRTYQTTSATKIREHFVNGVRAVLLVSPTGSGKTVTFSHIAKGAAARGNETLILAHRDFLINQASDKLTSNGVDHGIIMANYTPSPHAMVQVASVQTLIRRIKKYKYRFKLIIVDEAHLSCARTYLEIIDAFPDARILGVTGSPCRLDGRGLGRQQDAEGKEIGGRFDVLEESVSMRELIDDGYAVQPIVYAPLNRLDLKKVPKAGADYQQRALSQAMNNQIITGNAVEEWRAKAKHIPSATWCVDKQHARDTAKQFNESGIKTEVLTGDDDPDTRERVIKQIKDGSIYNITFCQLLIEGVDIAELGCLIGLRPTYSLAATLQSLGRLSRPLYAKGWPTDTREQRFAAMRAGPKGLYSIHIDCAGLTFRHGFQDDDREWDLNGAPPRATGGESVAMRQCPRCGAVFKPGPLACPECEFALEINSRQIKTEEGELGLLTPEMLAKASAAKEKQRRKVEVAMAGSLEEFQKIASERGYSPNWANIRWRIYQAKELKRDEASRAAAQMQPQLMFEDELLQREVEALKSNPKFNFDREWEI